MSNEKTMEINRHGMFVPKAAQSTEARVPSPPRFKVSDGHIAQHSRSPGHYVQGGYPIQVVLQQKAENPGTPQAPREQPASHGSLVVQPPPSLSPEDAQRPSLRSPPQLQDSNDSGHLPSESVFAAIGTDLHRQSLASAPFFLGPRTYQYRPIEETSIRLVRLLPERKTMIKCEILHVSLRQPPPYVAVSYTWGDTGDTRKIEVEGISVHVAVSLHGALQALREKQTSLLIWVDALCIDQKNRDERSQQVQLMPNIYSNAESVAIWLGPEENDSTKAVRFIEHMSAPVSQIGSTSQLLSSGASNGHLLAVVSLFGRDYWRRLWVVQEVFNAKNITVYCGPTKLPWMAYQYASATFGQRRGELIFTNKDPDTRRLAISPDQFSYVQTLVYQGPASLRDLRSYVSDGEMVLLEVLRACRRKLASDPRDKLYGILGVLPASIRDEFRADYNLSVKDVYTEVVDFLLKTTERLDIICEAIHFPVHTSSANLPSFVPDWSHIPQTSAMGFKYGFSAAGSSKAVCRFCDERLNKLEVSAIEIDVIRSKGVAVGTLCNLGDYLMAFLHWSALLFQAIEGATEQDRKLAEERFAATLCLGQIPSPYDRHRWLALCYHIFACLFRDRLPYLPLDLKLRDHLDTQSDVKPEMRRHFLQTNFGDRMMGRCFCLTQNSRMGMGSGFMLAGDIIVVPLGCSTPILLRAEGTQGEYCFVGDVYIDGYMYGRAVQQWRAGEKELKKYVLH